MHGQPDRGARHPDRLHPGIAITGVADSLRADSDWTVTDLDSGHNLLANGPDDLVTIILDLGW